MTKGYQFLDGVIPIMDQSKNEHTSVRESDDEFKLFHSSDTKDDITVYEVEELYAKE